MGFQHNLKDGYDGKVVQTSDVGRFIFAVRGAEEIGTLAKHDHQTKHNRDQKCIADCTKIEVYAKRCSFCNKRQRHIDSKDIFTSWLIFVRVQRLAVIACAAARCCYCGNREAPLPKIEGRPTKKRGRGSRTEPAKIASTFLPTAVASTYILAAWMGDLGGFDQHPTCFNEIS